MKIIQPSYQIIGREELEGMKFLKRIEEVGRTCYKSEDKITETSAINFAKTLIKNGHEAMIEHNIISVRFICDRGVSHELVRHRLASFGQESTRYCNYSNEKFGQELTVIAPCFFTPDSKLWTYWESAMLDCENMYFRLLENGAKPQEARSVLPNSLKTEIVVSMNIREWRHFFKLRCDTPAHPQMRQLTIPLLHELQQLIPVVFADLNF